MLTQRTSIAGANAGAKNVAPRTVLQTACRTRCRKFAASNRRTSAVASAGRRRAVPVYATSQLQALGTSIIKKAAKAASPGIFIAGAEGQIALRLLKDLAVAGEKVTAGVADVDRAEEALQFAKKYEVLDSDSLRNIKLIELDYSDVEELASTFPRRGKLVIVDGDVVAGGNQADKLPAVLAAAAEAEVTPIIITSGPSAAKGGKSGGGLFAFGGRGDGRGRVAGIADKVGLEDYVIIQAAGLDPSGPPASPRNLVVAESGTIDPATAGPVGQSEVFQVLTAVLAAPRLPGGPISLSIAGTGADAGDVRGQLAAALSTIGERNEVEAAARKGPEEPAAGIFGFGSRQSSVKEPEIEEEEEEAPARPSLFGFGGTRKVGKPAAAPEEEEDERPAKPLGLFGFGTKKAKVQVEEEEEEEEEEERPRAKSPLSLFGFGAKPVQAAEEEEEEEEEEAPARPAFSLFGGGAQKKQQVAEPEEDEEEVSAGLFSFGTRRIKARAQQSGKVQELSPAQKAAQARAEAAEETKRRQEEARAQAEALRERRQKEAAEARAAALEAQRRKQEEARTAGAQAQRKREDEQGRRTAQARAQAAEAQRRKQEEARAAAAETARRKQEEARAAAAENQRRKQAETKAAAAEAARKKKQDEARARAEAASKAREDQRRKQEEARAAAAEAARKKQEDARAKAEAAAKAKAEQQKLRADELKRKQADAAKARAKAGTGTTSRPGTPVGRTGTARAGSPKPGTQPVKQATQVKRPVRKSSSSSKEQDKNDSRGMITFGPKRR